MRTYQLRIYTLRSPESFEHFTSTVYPRHLNSFPRFGVQAHGFWTAIGDTAPRLYVLVSYAEGDDPDEVTKRYLQSPELAEDVRDFDSSNLLSVQTTALQPSTGSPLQ